jgi:hypothetical protein
VFTTGLWYVRLCQAVASTSTPGRLSAPFVSLPDDLRTRALHAVLELPDEIGLVSLRTLGPVIGRQRRAFRLNLLAAEAVAAAEHLGARVVLGTESPRLIETLDALGIQHRVV